MIVRSIFHSLAVVMLLALGACAQGSSSPIFPEITFNHLSPYQLAVGSVEVESTFKAQMTPPHAEHKVPQSPEQVMRQWARDRLKTTGGDMFARFIILDATVTEHALATDGTLKAVFTNEQEMRYQAAAEASLEIRGASGNFLGNATARVARSITIPEKTTLNERDQILFDLIDRLMKSFNTELDANIRRYLSKWVQ